MIFDVSVITITELIFYGFATLSIFSALAVVTVRNPVYAVFFLIFAFFNSAALLILIGAEYIAMSLVVVYVGAVAMLFLFVVMMMDVKVSSMRSQFSKLTPLILLMIILIFIQLFVAFQSSIDAVDYVSVAASPMSPMDSHEAVNNITAIGLVLYTDYIFPFQLSGLILLVAMIGSICLTLRVRVRVKKQVAMDQQNRRREDSIELLDIKNPMTQHVKKQGKKL